METKLAVRNKLFELSQPRTLSYLNHLFESAFWFAGQKYVPKDFVLLLPPPPPAAKD